MKIYSDAYLDFWGDIFFGLRLHARIGMMFEQFLLAPRAALDVIQQGRCATAGRLRRATLIEIDEALRTGEAANALSARIAAMDAEPLLPAQQRVADRLADDGQDAIEADAERGTESLPRRNGQIVEPLHHHAHPRSVTRDFLPLRDLAERSEK